MGPTLILVLSPANRNMVPIRFSTPKTLFQYTFFNHWDTSDPKQATLLKPNLFIFDPNQLTSSTPPNQSALSPRVVDESKLVGIHAVM